MTRVFVLGALVALGEQLEEGHSLRSAVSAQRASSEAGQGLAGTRSIRVDRLEDEQGISTERVRKAGSTRTATPSKGCSLNVQPESGERSVTVGNSSRAYRLHVPPSYEAGDPGPLLVVFHGWGSTPQEEQHRGGLDHIADRKNAVVAYPLGLGDFAPSPDVSEQYTSWNSAGSASDEGTCSSQRVDYFGGECPESCASKKGGCGRCKWQTCADDDAFVDTLLEALQGELCVDTGRLFAVGDSNGGQLALSLGRRGKVAAAVSLAGLPHCSAAAGPLWHPGKPSSSRVLVISGAKDATVPADLGGAGDRRAEFADAPAGCTVSEDGWFFTPLEQVEAAAAAANDCFDLPGSPWRTPWDGEQGLSCSRRERCSADVAVCRWAGGHTWPKNYAPLVWKFLAEE